MNANNAKLIVVSAPSGCGKGTILREVFKNREVYYSVSCTTRPPRVEDKEGVTYYFLTAEEFEKKIEEKGFFEYAKFSDNYYGTPVEPVEENLAAGRDVVLEIETQGAFQVKKLRPDAVLIFILPPAIRELDRRLRKRNTETEEVILKRVSQAEGEIEKACKYDFVIMNDELETAIEDFNTVLNAVKNNDDSADRFRPENTDIKNMIRGVLDNA